MTTFLDPQGRTIAAIDDREPEHVPTAIKVSLVDVNLVSGSSDRLRAACGGYFTNTKNEDNLYGTPPPFTKFMGTDNPHKDILHVRSHYGTSVNAARLLNREVEEGQGAVAMGYSADGDSGYMFQQSTVLPSVTFVCRIEGDPRADYLSDVLQGSKYWKTLFMGGAFEHHTITPVYNEAAYDDHYITTDIPYTNLQKNYLFNGPAMTSVVGITPHYNRHFRRYQDHYSQFQMSELNIPNWYSINLMGYALAEDELSLVPDSDGSLIGMEEKEQRCLKLFDFSMRDYYTGGSYIPSGSVGLFEEMNSIVSPGTEAQIIELTTPDWSFPTIDDPDAPQMKHLTHYINHILPDKTAILSSNTMKRMRDRNKNIIFNAHGSSEILSGDSEAHQNRAAFPYYVQVEFPGLDKNQISNAIISRECSSIFMRTLKETFSEQTDNKVPVVSKRFLRNAQFVSSSADRSQNQTVSTSEIVSYRSTDFVKMLLYAYDNVLLTHEDFCFMDYQTLEVKAAEDTKALYRSYNSRNTSLLLVDILGMFGGTTSAVSVNNLNAVLNSQTDEGPLTPEEQAVLIPESKYHEVVAYRVEKVGGPPQPDAMTQGVLQNFWIFNMHSATSTPQILIDSQVKYDSQYSYKVYAYYVIKGFKYRYAGLQVSRLIGQIREDGYTGPLEYGSGIEGGPPTPPIAYCIEYYDPFTNTTMDDVMDSTGDIYGDAAGLALSDYSSDAQRAAASSVMTEGGNIMPPYVANITVTVQPSLRVVEVPILTKTVDIVDNPPNEVDVSPAYTIGNTNRLMFDLEYQTFSNAPYPRAISERDVNRARNYISSHDMTAYQKVQHGTVSPQRVVEIYRLDFKPTSFRDFDSVQPKTVSLAIDGSDFSYTTAVFNDIVKSNHKYYYLFRVLNGNNVAGNVDTIICAELVNDGGYKYGLFDTLFEEDLTEESYTDCTNQFNKIFQLSPTLNQASVDFEGANIEDTAKSQYPMVNVGTAEDLIWGKTFKIRLTSKKTGKKIDLNITYSDPDIILEEDDED